MVSEKTPITFFERIAKLIIGRLPNFFTKKLDVEKDAEIIFDLKKSEKVNFDSVKHLPRHRLEKIRDDINSENKVREFVIDWNINEKNHLEGHLPDGELKGQALLNCNYIAVASRQFGVNYLDNQSKPLIKALYNFNLIGKKIFRVEKHLMEELILTDCSKIDDEFLHLPFDTICLHYPYNTEIKVRDDFLEWVFITQVDFEEEDSYTSDFEIFCVAKSGIFYTETFCFEGGDIAAQIKEQAKIKYSGSKLAVQENIKLFSLITATLLYLNSESVDKTTITPHCISEKVHSRLQVCSLGRNIVINKHICNYSGEHQNSERVINILKWTVRGHFRHQKIGEKRQATKIIWIRPFLKGRERLNEELAAKPTTYSLV